MTEALNERVKTPRGIGMEISEALKTLLLDQFLYGTRKRATEYTAALHKGQIIPNRHH